MGFLEKIMTLLGIPHFPLPPPSLRPPNPSAKKKYEEMSPEEKARENDRLDDFVTWLRREYPEKMTDDNFRSLVAVAFFGGWQAGWEDHCWGNGETPSKDIAEKALHAGLRAGSTRAQVWIPEDNNGDAWKNAW